MQALKFCTLAITIYHYRNLDLTITITKIVQDVLETAKNENNVLLKTENFREKNFS